MCSNNMQRRNLIVQNHIRTIKRGDKKGGVDTMVDETIRSIKEAEQQAEEILVKAQGQKEQILNKQPDHTGKRYAERLYRAKRKPRHYGHDSNNDEHKHQRHCQPGALHLSQIESPRIRGSFSDQLPDNQDL